MSAKTTYVQIRVSETEAAMYRAAAELGEESLSVWARRALRAAAKRALRDASGGSIG